MAVYKRGANPRARGAAVYSATLVSLQLTPCALPLSDRAGETNLTEYLTAELQKRIMMIDGAMGTMIQVRRTLWPASFSPNS